MVEELVCPICGEKEFVDKNVIKDDTGYPCEYQVVCKECNHVIGLYSYGCFESYEE